MCTLILVKGTGAPAFCETVGELAEALKVEPVEIYPIINSNADEVLQDMCLCHIDIEELGGRIATDEEGFPIPEYIIELNKGTK